MVTHRGVSKSPETKERRRNAIMEGIFEFEMWKKNGKKGEKSLMSVT